MNGKNHRTSTKKESLSHAKEFAEDWYLELRGKHRPGELHNEKTFADVAKSFMHEYDVLTEGERNERWVKDHYRRCRMHLVPFFGKMGLSQVTAGSVQEYRIERLEKVEGKKIPSRSTLHHETVTLRLVLKIAIRHGWLAHLPDITTPNQSSGKIVHRAWFSPDEYMQLYEATRRNMRKAKGKRHKHLRSHRCSPFAHNTRLKERHNYVTGPICWEPIDNSLLISRTIS